MKRFSIFPATNQDSRSISPADGQHEGGTSHAVLSPMGFVKLVAVSAPKPSVNLTCSHGVFSPASKLRAYVLQRKRIEGMRAESPSASEKTYLMMGATFRRSIE